MKVNGHEIEIRHKDKKLFPEPNITKGEIIDYYLDISKYMLSYLKNRPLMLQRFPDGIDEGGFYQKEASDYFPDWIQTKRVEKSDGHIDQVICNDQATMVYLANLGAITFHSWLSTIDDINFPDKFIIDFDPPSF